MRPFESPRTAPLALLATLCAMLLAVSAHAATPGSRRPELRQWWGARGAMPLRAPAPGAPASSSPSLANLPAAAVSVPDGSGGVYIAWNDARDGTFDIFLQRVTSAGTVATGWPAEGLPICAAPGDQGVPVLFPDGANGVIVGWPDARDDWKLQDGYAQRVNASGATLWTSNGVKALTGLLGDIHVSPDGSGGLLLAWTAQGASDVDIYALRIQGSNGAPAPGWPAAGVLVCDATGDQDSPNIVTDAAGGAIVAWQDDRAGGGETHVFAQRLDGSGAAQWTPNGVQLDLATIAATAPTAVASSGNGAIVIWPDFGVDETVRAQRLDGAGDPQWPDGGVDLFGALVAAPFNLVAAPDGSDGAIVAAQVFSFTDVVLVGQRVDAAGSPQWGTGGTTVASQFSGFTLEVDGLVTDGSGGAFFVWEDYSSGADIRAQRVTPGGSVAWDPAGVLVCGDPGFQFSPVAAPDGSGGLTVAWQDVRTSSQGVYAQHLNSSGDPQLPTDGVAVFDDPGVQDFPLTAYDDAGGMWTVWQEQRVNQWDIRARRLGADGSPATPPLPVAIAPGAQFLDAAIPDGSGGLIVAWGNVSGSGTGDLRAQRFNAAGTRLWAPSGVVVSSGPVYRSAAAVVTDGSGGAILAWSQDEFGSGDIVAQRVTGAGALQWPGGVVVCGDPAGQYDPVLAPLASGGAIVAWRDDRAFQSAVYAQRLDGAGLAQWDPDGNLIGTLTSTVVMHGAIPDAAGGAIVLFGDDIMDPLTFTLLNSVLYAQRVDDAGAAQWGAAGSAVCDAGGLIANARIVTDDAGGAIVAWSDGRTPVFDIYGQHLDDTGTGLWGTDGLEIHAGPGWQTLTGLDADGLGGAVLGWNDERNGYPDVYAQRVNSLGGPLWNAAGEPVCDASRGQYAIGASGPRFDAIASDGAGAAFLAWTDNRAGNERLIYAQRVGAAGTVSWDDNGITSTLVSLVEARAGAEGVRITWQTSPGAMAVVYRRSAQDWAAVGTRFADGAGQVHFEDRDVVAGGRYGYRLGLIVDGAERAGGEVWVEVPLGLQLALEGLRPNPAVSELVVAFTLPGPGPARLEILDAAGRRVLARDLEGHGAGRHTLALGRPRLPAGVYLLRVAQAGRTATARAVIAP